MNSSKNRYSRTWIIGALASVCMSSAVLLSQAQQTERMSKAVIVIIDGIPADVIERVATPHIDAIAGKHGYTRSFVGGVAGASSETPTISAPGYQSLLTGTWADKHNVLDNEVENPNYQYWDIFRIAKHASPTLKTAVFSTWLDNRTKLLGDGIPDAGGKKIDYHFDGFEHDEDQFPHDFFSDYILAIDQHVSAEAARYIKTEGPDLAWVYLQYTDDVAHLWGDGDKLDNAVRGMDELVGQIWGAVQARRRATTEDWMMLVTTDHGRDAESGRSHGGQSERERTIWMVTNSDRLNARYRSNTAIVDIAPSIADHMGIDMPVDIRAQMDGRSFVSSPLGSEFVEASGP